MSLKYKHLEERSKYEERYDRRTVEECRWFEKPHLSSKTEQKKKGLTDEQVGGIFTFARDMFLHEFVGNRYLEREKTINEWMESDKRRDDMLAEARPPLLPCPSCRQTMECMDVSMRSDIDTDREWLEFYLHCKPCRKIRHVYQNGSEIPRKIFLCEKCQKELKFSTRKKKGKAYFVETCTHCGHVKETLDILEEKEKVPTPEEIERFEYDKKRFCLSPEQGRRYEQWRENMKRIKGEEEEHKMNNELYDRLAEVKKTQYCRFGKITPSSSGKRELCRFAHRNATTGSENYSELYRTRHER